MEMDSGVRVFIEGNIGSGKTTLLSRLSSLVPDFHPTYEPVDRWRDYSASGRKEGKNVLDIFYKDSKRWGFLFQNVTINTMIDAAESVGVGGGGRVNLLERSVWSGKQVFTPSLVSLGMMTELEETVLLHRYSLLHARPTCTPHLFIYRDIHAHTCHHNMLKRGSNEEKGTVSLSYLESLEKYHRRWLGGDRDSLFGVRVLKCSFDLFDQDSERNLRNLELEIRRSISDIHAYVSDDENSSKENNYIPVMM